MNDPAEQTREIDLQAEQLLADADGAPAASGGPDDVALADVAADVPRPTFEVLPLSDEVRRALAEMDYVNPTPVQIAVWDPATRGRDAVVQARTGTGKTAAFGLPIIDHIIKRSTEGVQSLVLCPTRELAVQVSLEIEQLGKYRGTKIIAIYGGAPMERQIQAIQAGAQLVVGTPGRVLDHIRRGTLKTSNIRLLVLDEADEMLSMGFERELTAILESLPASRQTLLFSATVPPDIDRIARSRLKDPEFITLSGDHIGALSILHFTYLVASDKIGTLVKIIETEDPESAVVFCNTKDQTQAVASALQGRGYDADWLNGDLPQSERESVMARTKQGKLRFLVATDVAARGIDISHLTHVINFDFPFDAEAYVHRTGRTGRAGRTGTAISLVTPQDIGSLYLVRLTYKIRPIERVVPSASELKTRAEADLVVMLAEGLLPKGTHEDDRALARRLITHDQAEGILAGLLRDYLGARPSVQNEASDARRKTVRRGTMKRREDAPRARAEGGSSVLAGLGSPGVRPPQSPPLLVTQPVTPPAAPPEGVQPGPPAEPIDPAGSGARGAQREGRDPRDRGGRDRFGSGPRGDAPRGDRPRDDRPRDDRPRDDRPRDDRPRGDRPREEREERGPREDRTREDRGPGERPAGERAAPERAFGAARAGEDRRDARPSAERRDARPRGPSGRAPGAATDFIAWQPPVEEGDDEPLIPSRGAAAAGSGARTFGGASERASAPAVEGATARASGDDVHARPAPDGVLPVVVDDVPYVEVFLGVGRRDSARAQDILKALVDAGVDKDHIRRIRVRDRHAFVAIRKDDAEAAIARLHGGAIAGKTPVTVELARERGSVDEAGTEAPIEG